MGAFKVFISLQILSARSFSGIPKFFRYISERYPLTSQLIQENKIPEFDNLYLDFNGIIHNCSHPNDEDAHFRLSEEQIFTSIFTYVDHVFGKIKPKKLFFMAVDGVAPRAKMNQQRGRRFRTAKEAREVREKALRNGEELPKEKAFDSNCITPGTPFMTKLSEQLRYFINKKITEDAAWRDVEVVLSGHEVPGEGEHKIMEYIRLSKAQPDYNPNVRHCLYGLDADLVMLGLLSHDPHFCLLREEVKFGPSRGKKGPTSLEQQNFFLLHLSLLREYLDLEFQDVQSALSFPYNLERIIDDFVLFAVFVGNDFLPNLPDLHIHENGLEKLFEIYKRVLPGMDGYLNESGTINTQRLQVVLDELAFTEKESFEKGNMDMNWLKGKQAKHVKAVEEAARKGPQSLTKDQQQILRVVKDFVLTNRSVSASHSRAARLALPNTFSARDRAFITRLGEDLHLSLAWDEFDGDQNVVAFRFPYISTIDGDDSEEDEWEDEDDGEATNAVDRVLKKYERLKLADADDEKDIDEKYEKKVKEKMDAWKRDYYREKLEMSYDDPEQMNQLVYRYVEGLQWVMHYYYSGVASWSWFYDYHYAPRISDLKGIDGMHFEFKLGTPFKPFEQLMGVLPEASKEHIPAAFRDLMSDPNSPILDFYPVEFFQDLNGKKQDWEAVVKIPFITEERLLRAMSAKQHMLTAEEHQRNSFGSSTRFTYDPERFTTYPSSLPGFFPDIHRCQCVMELFDLPTLNGLHLVEGLCDGVFLGSSALAGFPSLKTVPYTAQLGYHGVNVFQSESRNKSMVVHIHNRFENRTTQDVAQEMVGKRTFINWPFLQEGLVVAVSDSLFRHEKAPFGRNQEKILATPHKHDWLHLWQRKVEKLEHVYSKRFGVIIGQTDILVHVRPLKGLKRLDSGAFIKEYEAEEKETEQVAQLAIPTVESEDPRYLEKDAPPLHEEFPIGSKIFFLGDQAYGVAAQISETMKDTLSVVIAYFPSDRTENEKLTKIVRSRDPGRYHPSYKVAEMLHISTLALSRITSTFMVITSDGQKSNLGLSLKFEAKGMKVLDYSQKSANGRGWDYSEKAVELLGNYKEQFPTVFSKLDLQGNDMVRASDLFKGENGDAKVKEIRSWLNTQGVRDFEPVSLFCDQLKKDTVTEIEKLADAFNTNRSPASIKKAIVKGIPRQTVLKPSHAVYRLQNQRFALGDRVIMVQDSGGVPLSVKGVVIGLNNNSMDIIWDVPFLSGTDLGGSFNSCLNLTQPQFIVLAHGGQRQPVSHQPQHPFGPQTVIRPRPGQPTASGFRPAQQNHISTAPVHIMSNPRGGGGGAQAPAHGTFGAVAAGRGRGRGRGGHHASDTNGHNGHVNNLRSTLNEGLASGPPRTANTVSVTDVATAPAVPTTSAPAGPVNTPAAAAPSAPSAPAPVANGRGGFSHNPRGGSTFHPRGGFRGGRGGFNQAFASRGGPAYRGFRGRGRGGAAPSTNVPPIVQS
ncbi:exonuclease II [Hysterangium stoloniferum]|nr:exonuclease II [Hysterangium stoloniferum]